MAADATAPAGVAESNPSVAAGTHRVFWPDGGEPVTVTIPAV